MLCFFYLVLSSLQSFGIGYLRLHPDGQARVHSDEPKPILRVKPTAAAGFRRYGFVDAVLGLDPIGKLGMLQSDFKVISRIVISLAMLSTTHFLSTDYYS